MTQDSKLKPRLKEMAVVRLQVYGLTALVLGCVGVLGYMIDHHMDTKPAMTIIAVVLAYPILLLTLTLFMTRRHGSGASDNDNQ